MTSKGRGSGGMEDWKGGRMEGEGSGSLSGLATRIAIADIAHPLDRMLIPRLILQKMVGSAHPTIDGPLLSRSRPTILDNQRS